MKSFLTELSEQLYSKYGRKISTLTILFPSQRARLFFTEALKEVSGGVVWSPRFATIDELMSSISELRTADNLRLIAELYRIYSKYHKEEFDSFYHWGDMLIADFDMVDKYMVDAVRLFTNVADIKEIEADVSYLTEEQKLYLSRFWKTINAAGSIGEQKERFLKIWRSLPTIYTEYKHHLRQLGIGYTGMIYRDAAEKIKSSDTPLLPERRYVVAGFNALSDCEKVLFDHLKNCYNADFAWDYSDYYFTSEVQEAGRFMRQNLKRYPSTLSISHSDLRSNISKLTVASTATSVAQCHYVSQILEQIAERNEDGTAKPFDRNTAIVLTDENLLMPLLYALPEHVKGKQLDGKDGVNVTMGYPLKATFAYSFVERLLELQSHVRIKDGEQYFYYVDVEGLLAHQYLSDSCSEQIDLVRKQIADERIYNVPKAMLSELSFADHIFVAQSSSEALIEYIIGAISLVLSTTEATEGSRIEIEYMLRIRTALKQLLNMVSSCNIELTVKLCTSLVRRHLQSVRIPFEGEPLEGLQIMGILETRNLDFKNVIVLSMSESNFPGTKITDNSYIPYSLRFAYNMPTQEHHQGVYGYYFYRLIERAERVWLLYNSTPDEKGSGEPSRYIRQLQYESGLPIEFNKVVSPVNVLRSTPISAVKDSRAMGALEGYINGEKSLSPTALSTFVQCPMRFYYRYIVGIKVVDPLEEGLDNKEFGNIFHAAAEMLYTDLIGRKDTLHSLLQITDSKIAQCVDSAIAQVCFGGADVESITLTGELSIVRRIVIRYLKHNLIAHDVANHDFTVRDLEKSFSYPFTFESAGKRYQITLEGRADRIDTLDDNTLRIIDYKTGEQHLYFAGFEALFNGKASQRQSNTINTLMYAMIASRRYNCDIQPALYYLRDMNQAEYSPLLREGQGRGRGSEAIVLYSSIAEAFEEQVMGALSQLFDPQVPFCQAQDENSCNNCDFAQLCNRGKRAVE